MASPDAAIADASPVGLRVVERFQGRLLPLPPSEAALLLRDNTDMEAFSARIPIRFGDEGLEAAGADPALFCESEKLIGGCSSVGLSTMASVLESACRGAGGEIVPGGAVAARR